MRSNSFFTFAQSYLSPAYLPAGGRSTPFKASGINRFFSVFSFSTCCASEEDLEKGISKGRHPPAKINPTIIRHESSFLIGYPPTGSLFEFHLFPGSVFHNKLFPIQRARFHGCPIARRSLPPDILLPVNIDFHHIVADHLQFPDDDVLMFVFTGSLDIQHVFVVPILISKPRGMLVLCINPDSAFLFNGRGSANPVDAFKLQLLVGLIRLNCFGC